MDPYPCLNLKYLFFDILMLISDFILIILRQKYRRHKIDVKFHAESIPTVRITIYIGLHLKILDFLLIFDFPAFPYFVPLFWVQIWILRKILHEIEILKKIFTFDSKLKSKSRRKSRFLMKNFTFLLIILNFTRSNSNMKKNFKTLYPV